MSAHMTETDDALKAELLAETDDERRWDLLVKLHDRGWSYRPFNYDEPFARRRGFPPAERRYYCCERDGGRLGTCPGHTTFGADCPAWDTHMSTVSPLREDNVMDALRRGVYGTRSIPTEHEQFWRNHVREAIEVTDAPTSTAPAAEHLCGVTYPPGQPTPGGDLMTAPTVHADMGVAWITRGADGIHIEPEEIPAVVAALLVERDRLLDAADDVVIA